MIESYIVTREAKPLHSGGIVPEIELLEISMDSRFTRLPHSQGNVPVRLFPAKCTSFKCVKALQLLGRVPDRLFQGMDLRYNICKERDRQNVRAAYWCSY